MTVNRKKSWPALLFLLLPSSSYFYGGIELVQGEASSSQKSLLAARLATEAEEAQTLAAEAKGDIPRGYTACSNFMRNRKAQMVEGQDLVEVVGTMCLPAVEAGIASYRYHYDEK